MQIMIARRGMYALELVKLLLQKQKIIVIAIESTDYALKVHFVVGEIAILRHVQVGSIIHH